MTRKIKVFVDGRVFDGSPQGTTTFISEIYQIISRSSDFEVYLGVCTDNIFDMYPNLAGSVNVVKYKSKKTFLLMLYELPLLIKKLGIDVAHFQYIVPFFKVCRYIVTTHDLLFLRFPKDYPFFYRFSRAIYFKFSALVSDIVTTVSDYSKVEINNFFNIPLDKILVTRCGVNSTEAIDKSIARKEVLSKFKLDNFLLYVSRFEPRKNHIALIKAYVDLKLYDSDISLVFVGHRTLATSDFNNFLDSLDDIVRSRIIFVSGVSVYDLNCLYASCSVFIYPSLSEGFGIPPLEAALQEAPTICSNLTAMSEFTFFGPNHIDISDYELFKSVITRNVFSAASPYDLKVIKEVVVERYSWHETAFAFMNTFRKFVL